MVYKAIRKQLFNANPYLATPVFVAEGQTLKVFCSSEFIWTPHFATCWHYFWKTIAKTLSEYVIVVCLMWSAPS